MYKAAAPRVFLQRSERVEAAWLCCRLMQRRGRKGLNGEEGSLAGYAAGPAKLGYWAQSSCTERK